VGSRVVFQLFPSLITHHSTATYSLTTLDLHHIPTSHTFHQMTTLRRTSSSATISPSSQSAATQSAASTKSAASSHLTDLAKESKEDPQSILWMRRAGTTLPSVQETKPSETATKE
jgi:hypothetical protein